MKVGLSTTPCRVTPSLGAQARAYDGEYYTPTLRLAMLHALAGTWGPRQTSFLLNHLAAPSRQRTPWDVPPPLDEGFGNPNRSLLDPWYDGRAEIISFRYLSVLLGGGVDI